MKIVHEKQNLQHQVEAPYNPLQEGLVYKWPMSLEDSHLGFFNITKTCDMSAVIPATDSVNKYCELRRPFGSIMTAYCYCIKVLDKKMRVGLFRCHLKYGSAHIKFILHFQ